MLRRPTLLSLLLVFCLLPLAMAQTVATSDPQAVALVNQSLNALTGGTAINDVTLQATATYTAGSDLETGPATLEARVGYESRVVLTLTGGQRSEIRNNSTGLPWGAWSGPDGVWHAEAMHNGWTDPSWFFPALTIQAALNDPQVGLIYIGQEARSGVSVYHLELFRVIPGLTPSDAAFDQRLSAMDLYFDAASYLPVAVDFYLHPDIDAGRNLAVEIQFGDYRVTNGMGIPSHIQKFLQGGLVLDLQVLLVLVNSGIPETEFAIPTTAGA